MRMRLVFAMAFAAAVSSPLAANAQGTLRGAQDGAEAGGRAAGPVGAVVGGAVGAAAGTIGGILGVQDRPRFRQYVVEEHRPSYHYGGQVRVGTVLPGGVVYYAVPPEYHVTGYRYAIVNDQIVLIDPRAGRIVEVIE